MKYQAVFFDLDGTIMDTSKGIILAIDYVITKFKLFPLTEKEKYSFIGPPIQDSFQRYYGCSRERAWELATTWREEYKEQFLLEARPYDGIYELLHGCRERGIQTGVVTNKREDYTVKLLKHFSFLPLFDFVIGTDFDGRRTKAEMIRMCTKRLGIDDPKRCVMVGDTMGDINAAREAGVHALGVTYGFGLRNDIEGNFKMADSCSKILDLLYQEL